MENSISSDLIRGHIDTIILQTISETDKNSQEIIDEISSKSDGKYELKQPTLYSSLKRLESDGFIKSFWRDAEDGRRKFFHLTDKGRSLVRKNLNDWKFSRAVIDVLVKAEPDVKTEIVYKEVQVPYSSANLSNAESAPYSPVSPSPAANSSNEGKNLTYEQLLSVKNNETAAAAQTSQNATNSANKTNFTPIYTEQQAEQLANLRQTADKNEKSVEVKTPEYNKKQDVNFRNILNGLIIYSEQRSKKPSNIPTDNPEVKPVSIEKARFSDEIVKTDKINVNSDFGDVIDYCESKNLKLRVSAKSAIKRTGVYINKINFAASISIFSILAIELIILFGKFKSVLPSFTPYLLVIFAIFPLLTTLRYVSQPRKTIYKRLSSKDVLQMAFIVTFGLIFLNVVLYIFILGLDFSTLYGLITYLVFPVMLYIDAFLYYAIRALLFKRPSFKNFAKDN